jgi:hypothetical protein
VNSVDVDSKKVVDAVPAVSETLPSESIVDQASAVDAGLAEVTESAPAAALKVSPATTDSQVAKTGDVTKVLGNVDNALAADGLTNIAAETVAGTAPILGDVLSLGKVAQLGATPLG